MIRNILGLGALIALAVTGSMIFFWAPIEFSMGIVQKIMYLHVPSIWTTFLAFMISFFCSIGYLWKRKESLDIVACSAAEIGVVFCALALITGSIWGKPTWNTYWSWDARLTTTLLLFLIFVGYLLLRKFTGYGEQQARFAAIVAIIGTLDIPIIHMSVVWWRTLHQPSTFFSPHKNVIDTPLAIMLWVSVCSFTIFFSWLLTSRVELEKKRRSYLKIIANL